MHHSLYYESEMYVFYTSACNRQMVSDCQQKQCHKISCNTMTTEKH